MKTKLLTIVSVLMLFSSCNENNLEKDSKNDLEEENLKGKVRRIIENSYYAEYKFGEPQKGEKIFGQSEDLFNEQGMLIEKRFTNIFGDRVIKKYNDRGLELETILFNEEGGLNSKTIYQYDKDGNRIERAQYDSKGKLERKEATKYDENGNRIEKVRYNSNGKIEYKESVRYDDKGNETEINYYELDKLVEKEEYVYKYDNEGNKIEEEGSLYDSEGELKDRQKNVNKYNRKGNLIEEIRYDLKGNLEHKLTYKYDKNDNETEVCRYNSDGKLIYKRSQRIDNKGNTLEEEYINNFDFPKEFNGSINECDIRLVPVNVLYDSEITRETNEYDNYGNITKKTDYKSYLMTEVVVFENECSKYYEYQFDDRKNWIIKTESVVKGGDFEKENATKITDRKIEYYK